MDIDSIDLTADPRVQHCHEIFNGRHYHYIVAEPNIHVQGTIFLAHGWPDLSIGWRYQIPMLIGLGYRVVCVDLLGFGDSEVPRVPPAALDVYSTKTAADDIKALALKLDCDKITMGGHDWGGLVAYRVALWHPDLVARVFSICTPYSPPSRSYSPVRSLVYQRGLAFWTYQLQLASGEVEDRIRTKDQVRQALNATFGGKGENGEVGFDVEKGFLFENLPKLRRTKLMDDKTLDFYASKFAQTTMHQTTCWYRSHEQNFENEKRLEKRSIEVPVLFIQATKDEALPPSLSVKMGQYMPQLTRRNVETSHWALWEDPKSVNDHLRAWLSSMAKTPSTRL